MDLAVTTIEVTGMVGAGKSTVAGWLRSDLRAGGHTVLDMKTAIPTAMDRSLFGSVLNHLMLPRSIRARTLTVIYKALVRPALVARLAVRNPALVWSVLVAFARSPLPMRHRRTILGLVVRRAAALPFVTCRLRANEVLLLDEGLVHRAVNLFAWSSTGVDRASVNRYLALVPRSDLIVLVEAPSELCAERARSRGFPMRLRGRDDESVRRFMENSAAVIEVISTFLARVDGWSVVVDNGDEGANDGRDELRAAVGRGRLGGARAHSEPGTESSTTPRFEASHRWALPRPHAPSRSRRPQLEGDVVRDVLAAFGLSATDAARPIPGESRADNAVVSTRVGPKLLKRYKSTVAASSIEHEHVVLRHLERKEFAAPRLHAAPDGRTLIEIGGRHYAAFDHEQGYFHFNEYMWLPSHRRQLVTLSGRALAALHTALADFVPGGSHPLGFTTIDGPRRRELDWYLARLRDAEGGSADGRDTQPDEEGRELWSSLRLHRPAVEDRLRTLDRDLDAVDPPRQIIHGDYGPYNILFKPGEQIMILDFEMARLDWRVIDLAKSAQQFAVTRFGFRPERLDCFVSAYLRTLPLEADELQLLPLVWQFLHLRRVVVCWTRYCETGQVTWLRESKRKLQLADLPISGVSAPFPNTP